jgi:hypothetical protein
MLPSSVAQASSTRCASSSVSISETILPSLSSTSRRTITFAFPRIVAPDAYGNNLFSVSSSASDTHFVSFDNGNSSTSGSSYIPAGTYTFTVSATGAWRLSF